MYRMKMFLERANFPKVQTYNVESALNIRVYNMGLFASNKLNFLVSTPEFLADIKKNRKNILYPKTIKNILVFNSLITHKDYQNLVELIKGTQDF